MHVYTVHVCTLYPLVLWSTHTSVESINAQYGADGLNVLIHSSVQMEHQGYRGAQQESCCFAGIRIRIYLPTR